MYGIQISLEIAMCVLLNTYVLYNFYMKFMEEISDTQGLILQLIRTFLLCLQHSTKIFAVNYLCDKTTKEVCESSDPSFYFIL